MLFAAFSLAAADPVYLSCSFSNGDRSVHHDITLNEADGTATISVRETGFLMVKRPAVFVPDKVTISVGGVFDESWTISRTDLSYLTGTQFSPMKGKCELMPKPEKRKF